jgi:hypothetical protein
MPVEARGRLVSVFAYEYAVFAGLVARYHDPDAIDAHSAELVGEAAAEIGQDAGAVGSGSRLAVLVHACLLM